jgi:hypothetical protein
MPDFVNQLFRTAYPATGRTLTESLADRAGNTFIDVKADYGAKGDGVTNDTAAIQAALNAAFGTGTGSIVSTAQRRVIFPPGKYIVTGGGLTAKNWFGGCVSGSGRFTTIIQNSSGPVITTNGCEYMRFEDMNLDGGSGGQVLFDLDWDGAGGTTALQSNTFFNMYFSNGGIGLRIANTGGGSMGSENLFLTCFFGNMSTDGMQVVGGNALQQTIIGGDFQACSGAGVHVFNGSVNVISGVGFQANGQDIQIDGAANNTMTVTGCRTESSNFINNPGTQAIHISGCHQTTASSRGLFYLGDGGYITLDTSIFDGQIDARGWTQLNVCNCQPHEVATNDWLILDATHWSHGVSVPAAVMEIEEVLAFNTTALAYDPPIAKRRIFTTDGTTITTQNYSVFPIAPDYQAPATGFAHFMKATDQNVIIDPTGTLATGAIFLPPAPFSGQLVDIRFSQAVTRLAIIPTGSLSAVGTLNAAAIGTELTAVFNSSTGTWYCAPGTVTTHGGVNLVLDSISTFKNSGVASIVTTGDAPAGSLIFAFVGASNGSPDTITALTDSAGNTYTLAAQSAGAAGFFNTSIWFCNDALHLPVGSTFTATTASAGTYVIAAGYALGYSGGKDKTTVNSAITGTSASLASGVLTVANELVVAAVYNQAASVVYTEGAGFATLINHASFDFAWQIVSSTASVSYAPSWNTATNFTAVLATFEAGA